MTKDQQQLAARAEKLRLALADAQAVVDNIRAKLTPIEAKLAGEPCGETGLDMLWKAAPAMARTRSSKFKCRVAWNRIPPRDRPRVPDLLAALKAWSRCGEWKKDEGQFIPALDRWIRERRWEDLPEDVRLDPNARYRVPQKPIPVVPPEDRATPEYIAAFLNKNFPANPTNPNPDPDT